MRTSASGLPLALLAALVLAPRAGADVASLHGALDDSLLGVQEAARLLLGRERVAATTALDGALSDADVAEAEAADAGTRAELGVLAGKVEGKVAAYRRAVAAARKAMADVNAPELKAIRAAEKAARAGYKVKSGFIKLPGRGPTPVERNARSAGFHDPGDFVEFLIHPGLDSQGDPCLETPVFVVVDPYGNGSVVPGTPVSVANPDGTVSVTVEMGASGGPARLEVTSCGVTRSSLLFNYGPKGTFAPRVTADRFDGTYNGTYTGTAKVDGYGSVPVAGTVTFTVAGGVINVTSPGTGAGAVNARGTAGMAGSGAIEGDAYGFAGKFTATSFGTGPGSAIAGGTWHSEFAGGNASGTWNASR